jgi:predicted metal-binding protein
MRIEPVPPHAGRALDSRLQEALGSLQELCIDSGASACAVIECVDLVFAERAAEPPDMPTEERSIFWPVPRFPQDSIEDAMRQYRQALVFRLDIAGRGSRDGATSKIYDIAGRLESACFYGGFYLAIGLAAGNCREVFCGGEKKCQALTVGKPCLYPLRSRPSVEACGLDLEAIAAKAGWGDLEAGSFVMGMVFIA